MCECPPFLNLHILLPRFVGSVGSLGWLLKKVVYTVVNEEREEGVDSALFGTARAGAPSQPADPECPFTGELGRIVQTVRLNRFSIT